MSKRQFLKGALAATLLGVAAVSASADDLPYNLTAGKPFDGTKLNILSVVTPQFDGLMLRADEFKELTGIDTEWTFIRERVFNDDGSAAWTTDAAIAATEDYVKLLTEHGVANPNSLAFVEQDARQSFMQGKSAMIPGWWWFYSGFQNPETSTLTKEQIGFVGMPSYAGTTKTYAISMPFAISTYSKNQDAAWEFLKWLSNPAMDKANATEREVKGKSIVNNVVTHISSLQDEEVNAANDNIQLAAWESLKESDIMPQIAEWPEVGDLLSAAIAEAAAGGDTRQLMTDAEKQANRILKRAGRIK